MRKTGPFVAACVVILLLAGCATAPRSDTELQSQVRALSNEVQRLTHRLERVEGEWNEIKPSMDFIQKLMDEMRYEPVVHTDLIGVPDDQTPEQSVGGDSGGAAADGGPTGAPQR